LLFQGWDALTSKPGLDKRQINVEEVNGVIAKDGGEGG